MPLSPKPPQVYLMHGLPASGKTTFARALAADKKALRLNGDEYVAAHFSAAEQEADWDGCFGAAIAALWLQTATAVANGQDVILDFGFWTRENRTDARTRIAALGADYVHYFMDTPDDIILARLQKREGGIARRNVENFERLKKIFERPDASEGAIYIRPDTNSLNE